MCASRPEARSNQMPWWHGSRTSREGLLGSLTRPPLLVAEALSPDSVLRDLNLKKAAYERFGIPSYWVVDPDVDRAARPFSVEIVPDQLVAKFRRS
jgi:Uma2 family endonuclease